MNADLKVSQLFPPFQRKALVDAAASRDWREIDRITDTLVLMGLCRPRSDLRPGHRIRAWFGLDQQPRIPNEFE